MAKPNQKGQSFVCFSLLRLACEEKQLSKRQEISSRPWFSAAPASAKGAAGSLLHRINQQSKEAAVAKALGSSHASLVRKRTDASETCAAVTRGESEIEPNTRDKDASEIAQAEESVTVSPQEEGTGAQDTSLGPLGSLVPDYNDSDSDSGSHNEN